jgi:hypothetical protein
MLLYSDSINNHMSINWGRGRSKQFPTTAGGGKDRSLSNNAQKRIAILIITFRSAILTI